MDALCRQKGSNRVIHSHPIFFCYVLRLSRLLLLMLTILMSSMESPYAGVAPKLLICSLRTTASSFVRQKDKRVTNLLSYFSDMRQHQGRKLMQTSPRYFSTKTLHMKQGVKCWTFWGQCKIRDMASILAYHQLLESPRTKFLWK